MIYQICPNVYNSGSALLEEMVNRHCKIFFIRFDVRFPQGFPHSGKNEEISELIKQLCSNIKYHGVDCGYLWAREQNESEAPHYHLILLVDGNKIQDSRGIFNRAEEIWRRIVSVGYGGLIDHCYHSYQGQQISGSFMIRRPSSEAQGQQRGEQEWAFDQAMDRARSAITYAAKAFSKDLTPYRVRDFGCSRLSLRPIPPNPLPGGYAQQADLAARREASG